MMDTTRRNLLKVSATVTASAAAVFTSRAFGAQEPQTGAKVESIPPLASQLGARLVTYSTGGAPSIGIVLDDGHLLNLKAEAHARQLKLAFDPDSMLSLIKAGDPALHQVKALSEHPKSCSCTPETREISLLAMILGKLRWIALS